MLRSLGSVLVLLSRSDCGWYALHILILLLLCSHLVRSLDGWSEQWRRGLFLVN